MKKFVIIILVLCCNLAYSQKVKGVVTYVNKQETKADVGAHVYIIPVKNESDSNFIYISTYNSKKYNSKYKLLHPGNVSSVDALKEWKTTDADIESAYGNKIRSLEKQATNQTMADGSANYFIEGIQRGRYLILIKSAGCYSQYAYTIRNLKDGETSSFDNDFSCLESVH